VGSPSSRLGLLLWACPGLRPGRAIRSSPRAFALRGFFSYPSRALLEERQAAGFLPAFLSPKDLLLAEDLPALPGDF
jgi:hypothetical protein